MSAAMSLEALAEPGQPHADVWRAQLDEAARRIAAGETARHAPQSAMRIGSLFSGIGGLELGLERAGLGRVAWQVEIDPYCRAVLARHWPDVTRYTDVRAAKSLPAVDVVCGGFPCQDISGAGLGAGLAGARSGLWYEYARIVQELRPRIVIVENVASGKARWLSEVRGNLCELGYDTRAYALSAADIGAPHLRRRVFVVAYCERDGSQGGEQAGATEGAARRGGAHVADGDGDGVRQRAERVPGGRTGELRGQGSAEPIDAGETMADGDRVRRRSQPPPRANGARSPGDNARGRHRFPPRRGDAAGWVGWIASGGPEPGVRRGAHGIPAGVDGASISANVASVAERLSALGNAVVPQCAEVIGRIAREWLKTGIAA